MITCGVGARVEARSLVVEQFSGATKGFLVGATTGRGAVLEFTYSYCKYLLSIYFTHCPDGFVYAGVRSVGVLHLYLAPLGQQPMLTEDYGQSWFLPSGNRRPGKMFCL